MRWTKISADLAWASSDQVVKKLFSYAVLMILSRYLAPERLGEFFFAATLAALVAMIAELGTSRYLIREIAEELDSALDRLGDVLMIRLWMTAASFMALNAITLVLLPDLWDLVLLTSVYVLAGDAYYSFGAFFIGLRRVKLRFLTGLAGPLILLALVVLAVYREATLNEILGCYIAANVVAVAVAALVTRLRFGPFPISRPLPGAVRRVVVSSLPFFLLKALGLLQFKLDSVMIFALFSAKEVARYETAYKLLEISRVVVRPAVTVFFPLTTRLVARGDWSAFESTFRLLTGSAGLAGTAIALVGIATASWLMPLLWGAAYTDSALILQVLCLSIPPVFVAFVGSFLAQTLHLERRVIRITAACLAVNLALNLVAIPIWGAVGAAGTTLLSETLLAGWILGLLIRQIRSGVLVDSDLSLEASTAEAIAAHDEAV